MTIMKRNMYSPVDKTQTTTTRSNINTEIMFPTKVYLTAAIGTTSLTTTDDTPFLNHSDPSVYLELDYYQAQQYHKTTCNKNLSF